MRITAISGLAITAALALSTPAFSAQSTAQKSCILSAAENLPKIQDLQVVDAYTKDMTDEQKARWLYNTDPDQQPMLVFIKFKAASVQATMEFACSSGPRSTNSQSLGVSD